MEKTNAAFTVLSTIAKEIGVWAGHVSHVPITEVIAGLNFDQQAECIINGLRVTTHSRTGNEWPVYIQVHDREGIVHRVVGYYTPQGLMQATNDIIRYTNIPS